MIKKANTDHPIHELITNRWSPYKFADRFVSKEDLLSLFEAARWAPSSYNEQPWRFIMATNDQTQEFEKLLSCLVPANQEWAKRASTLVLGVTHLVFDKNGKENKAAIHDLVQRFRIYHLKLPLEEFPCTKSLVSTQKVQNKLIISPVIMKFLLL